MKASEIMSRASTILLDDDYTRWTMTELAMWLTDALREVALVVPKATSKNITIPLVEGTRQQLPANCQQLLRVVRNVRDLTSNPERGQKLRKEAKQRAKEIRDGRKRGG